MASSKQGPFGARGDGPKARPKGSAKSSGPSRNAMLGVVGAVVVVVAAVMVYLSLHSSNGSSGPKTTSSGQLAPPAGVADVQKLLDGIPQTGLVLGDPNAKATLVEYGDLRCPSCRQWDTTTAPKVIEQLVRTGKIKLEFRLWPITSDAQGTNADAINAARSGMAAAAQNRYWYYALLFYKNQVDETKTYVVPTFTHWLASAAGIKDLGAFDKATADNTVEAAIQQNGAEATNYGFNGTPSFLAITAAGKTAPLQADQTDVAAIAKELGVG